MYLKDHIKNEAVRNSNCIEYVMCNILSSQHFDYGMLFADSWNVVYRDVPGAPLHTRVDVYAGEYKQLYDNLHTYYGISVSTIPWTTDLGDYNRLLSLFDANEYIAICMDTHYCDWLISIDGIEEYHYLLVKGISKNGILCYDYQSINLRVIDFSSLIYGAKKILIFSKASFSISRDKYLKSLIRKYDHRRMYEHTAALSKVFEDEKSVEQALNIGEPIVCPFLRKISYIGFGRENFIYALRPFMNTSILPEDIGRIKRISAKWLLINKKLVKYKINHNSQVLAQIKKDIVELGTIEDRFLKELLGKLIQ